MGKDATGSSYEGEAAPRAASPGVTPLRPPGGSPAAAAARVRRRRCAFDLRGLAAFAIYFALAVLFFARGLFGRFSTAYIGKGPDPQALMWLMAWWPHAIRHGLNPFYSRAVWAPRGINLMWTTNMPLLSLVLMPVVLSMGPVFAYNISLLLAVAIAGWCAFILCRYVSNAYLSSLAGGYVFAFSSYMVGQAAGHLVELLIFPVPLFTCLVIRGFRADISRRTLISGMVLVILAQALLAVEVFATMTVFAAIALLIVLIAGSANDRVHLSALLPVVIVSYAIAGILLSPFFYYMFLLGYERGALYSPLLYSTDLLNLLVPVPPAELGRMAALQPVSECFLGNMYEATGYVGIPLMLVVAAFAWHCWNERWARLLIIFLLAAVILSLGPFLLIGGRVSFPLPGAMLMLLPLIGKALPGRFMLYAFLALAMILALWLSTCCRSQETRVVVALVIAISMLPNLSARFWTTAVDLPSFFRDKSYTRYIGRDENIVILPYGISGSSTLWQLETDWYFRMAGGYVGPPPMEFRSWPVVIAFYSLETMPLPGAGDQLRAFFGAHGVSAVLVDDREEDAWRPLLATLGVTPVRAGGITLYRIPPAELAPWKNATALDMETRAARARFAALVLAAEARIRSGSGLAALTPADMLKPEALPPGWVVVPPKTQPPYAEGGLNLPRRPPNPHLFAGMWLNARPDGRVEVGVVGWYPALRTVLDEYRAAAVDFTPRDLAEADRNASDDRRGMLVMTFTAEGLARAAVIAQTAVAGKSTRAGIDRRDKFGLSRADFDQAQAPFDEQEAAGQFRAPRGLHDVRPAQHEHALAHPAHVVGHLRAGASGGRKIVAHHVNRVGWRHGDPAVGPGLGQRDRRRLAPLRELRLAEVAAHVIER